MNLNLRFSLSVQDLYGSFRYSICIQILSFFLFSKISLSTFYREGAFFLSHNLSVLQENNFDGVSTLNEIDEIARHFCTIEHPLYCIIRDIGLETEFDLLSFI